MVQYEKVLKLISNAKSEGATILTGGSRPEVSLCFLCKCVQFIISAIAMRIEYIFFFKFNGSI